MRETIVKFFAENILMQNGWQKDKTIVVENGKILNISDGKDDKAVQLAGPVIPGMVNLHSHAFQKTFAGLTEFRANPNDSFWSWRDAMYRMLQVLTPEDLKIVADYLYAQMLQNGYTSVAEFHYLHHQAHGVRYADHAINSKVLIQSALDTGINQCLCPVFYQYAGFGEQAPNSTQTMFSHSVEEFQTLLQELASFSENLDQITLGIAPHSLRAVSKQSINELVSWWQQKSPLAPIHIHIAEQVAEVEQCIAFYGERPVEWLMNQFNLSERWCLVHATHLTKQETKDLARSKAVAGLCPDTEGNLGDGIFNGVDFINDGGRFGIGSDSHITVSPFLELKTLEYSQRFAQLKRNQMCSQNSPNVGQFLWEQSALSGADAVNQKVGLIEEGFAADWLVLDLQVPELNACHENQWLDAAIFATHQSVVKEVYVAGNRIVENGLHVRFEKLAENYRALLKEKIKKSL